MRMSNKDLMIKILAESGVPYLKIGESYFLITAIYEFGIMVSNQTEILPWNQLDGYYTITGKPISKILH